VCRSQENSTTQCAAAPGKARSDCAGSKSPRQAARPVRQCACPAALHLRFASEHRR
jgi:hypothetical protein